jgi:hypothetical protein
MSGFLRHPNLRGAWPRFFPTAAAVLPRRRDAMPVEYGLRTCSNGIVHGRLGKKLRLFNDLKQVPENFLQNSAAVALYSLICKQFLS